MIFDWKNANFCAICSELGEEGPSIASYIGGLPHPLQKNQGRPPAPGGFDRAEATDDHCDGTCGDAVSLCIYMPAIDRSLFVYGCRYCRRYAATY